MKGIGIAVLGFALALASCSSDVSYVSIRNDTLTPIYALPYSSDLTNGEWIQPGLTDEFYELSGDDLDGFDYFSFYYDSLIVYLKDHDKHPVKFYKDGTTVNYNPTLNPFTNPDMWQTQEFKENLGLSTVNAGDKKNILEHFFPIDTDHVKSLSDTIRFPLNPA
jgi:hypothetical protein